LAFIYPPATILVIWVASGHVGPGEEALQLARDVSGWLRILTAATLLFTTYAFCRSWRVDGWKRLVWIALGYASGVALAAANNSPLAGVIGVAMAGGVAAVCLAPAMARVRSPPQSPAQLLLFSLSLSLPLLLQLKLSTALLLLLLLSFLLPLSLAPAAMPFIG
jgi:hypothetical protein